MRDLADDPGLTPTTRSNERGALVGRPPRHPLRRFSHDPTLDALLLQLYRGFGPQRWWPARTPFEVIVGAVLTQNTTWSNVELALAGLRRTIPLTPGRILGLSFERLVEAIRSSGTYRAKARKLVCVSEWYLRSGGLRHLATAPLEAVRTELLGVFGIGPETADSILCYAAGRRTVVVDTYTRRILARHGLLAPDLPYEEIRRWLAERLVASQAVAEEFHALCVRAGSGHCKPTPACATCPATKPEAVVA